MKVKFVVLGSPQGKGRPRFSRHGEKLITRTPEATVQYENLIVTEYRRQCGDCRFGESDMLDLRVFAFYEIPKSTSKKKQKAMESGEIRPTKKPDFDNIGKVVADSLNGVAYRDDAMIVDAQVRKFYSYNPKLEISIQNV